MLLIIADMQIFAVQTCQGLAHTANFCKNGQRLEDSFIIVALLNNNNNNNNNNNMLTVGELVS